MSSRSLNKVQLIGNLTRDPELRYTPTGAAVCTIGLATNRYWTTESGEKKEETEFHRVVAWNKLAELCSQLLIKGRKVYVEGRLRTSTWQGQDGAQRNTTEIVIEDMILLDSRRPVPTGGEGSGAGDSTPVATGSVSTTDDTAGTTVKATAQPSIGTIAEKKAENPVTGPTGTEEVNPDDIPF